MTLGQDERQLYFPICPFLPNRRAEGLRIGRSVRKLTTTRASRGSDGGSTKETWAPCPPPGERDSETGVAESRSCQKPRRNNVSLRDKPEDWTDDEIAVGLAEVVRKIRWKQDQHQDVEVLHAIARALADERDRRRVAVSREADESTVDISDWLRLVESDEWPWPDDTPPEDANRPG
jgi:hypothetical protein